MANIPKVIIRLLHKRDLSDYRGINNNPPLRFEKLGIFLWFLFFWSSGRKISQRFLFFSKKIRLRRVFIFTFSQNESIFSQNSRFCLKEGGLRQAHKLQIDILGGENWHHLVSGASQMKNSILRCIYSLSCVRFQGVLNCFSSFLDSHIVKSEIWPTFGKFEIWKLWGCEPRRYSGLQKNISPYNVILRFLIFRSGTPEMS